MKLTCQRLAVESLDHADRSPRGVSCVRRFEKRPVLIESRGMVAQGPVRRVETVGGDRRRRGRGEGLARRIYAVFQRHRDRIALFHFGGHADGDRLLLQSALEPRPAYAEGLATLLGQQRGLKLVFLNGCSTRPQVKRLLDAGVPAVIATARPIDDGVATEFAVAFYQALTTGYSGDNRKITGGCSLAIAFAQAEGLSKTARGRSPATSSP